MGEGLLSEQTREALAAEAFAYTARYDSAIARWFSEREDDFPATYPRVYEKVLDLPYGENPHQRAAYYAQANARTHLLSMVSKLAPAKYATMLMGLWMLTSTFGQFLGGELGEHYGTWTPTTYFVVFFIGTGVASLILLVFVRKIAAMMHGAK